MHKRFAQAQVVSTVAVIYNPDRQTPGIGDTLLIIIGLVGLFVLFALIDRVRELKGFFDHRIGPPRPDPPKELP